MFECVWKREVGVEVGGKEIRGGGILYTAWLGGPAAQISGRYKLTKLFIGYYAFLAKAIQKW
jgi:hypothetical protein